MKFAETSTADFVVVHTLFGVGDEFMSNSVTPLEVGRTMELFDTEIFVMLFTVESSFASGGLSVKVSFTKARVTSSFSSVVDTPSTSSVPSFGPSVPARLLNHANISNSSSRAAEDLTLSPPKVEFIFNGLLMESSSSDSTPTGAPNVPSQSKKMTKVHTIPRRRVKAIAALR